MSKLGFVLVIDDPDARGLRTEPWTDEVATRYGFDQEDRTALGEGETIFANGVAYYVEQEEEVS